MMFGLPQRLIGAGVICFAALIGLVIVEGRARAAGAEVILPMRPVDPRSILSGHYVQLAIDEPIPKFGACPWQDTGYGEDGWIALRRSGDRHTITAAVKTRADARARGEIVMRGAASCNPPTPANGIEAGADGAVTLRLAVERFHADQEEAVAIEKAMRDRSAAEPRTFVILSVDKDGTPRTKGLIVDGKRVELTWF